MALDPSIPLGIKPVQIQSPFEAMGQLAQLQQVRDQTEARRLAAEKARQDAQDAAAARRRQAEVEQTVRSAVTVDPATGRPRMDWLKVLGGNVPTDKIFELQKQEDTTRKLLADIESADFDLDTKKVLRRGALARTVAAAGYALPAYQAAVMAAFNGKALTPAERDAGYAVTDPAQIRQSVDSAIAAAEAAGMKIDAPDAGGLADFLGRTAKEKGIPVEELTTADVTTAIAAHAAASRAPKEETTAKVGSLEDYVVRTYGANPTPAQIIQARRAWEPPAPPALQLVPIIGPDGKAVLVPEGQAVGATPASAAGGQARPVTSADAGRIAALDTSRDDLAVLSTAITQAGTTGTAAKFGASLPNWVTDVTGWGTDAKQKQALIDRVKQVIGKALEDGVLRKEDEIKYEKILPTIGDANAIVVTKLQGLDAALIERRQTHLDALADAGYDVSRFNARPTRPPLTAGGVPQEGTEGVVNGIPAVWKTVNGKAGWYAK